MKLNNKLLFLFAIFIFESSQKITGEKNLPNLPDSTIAESVGPWIKGKIEEKKGWIGRRIEAQKKRWNNKIEEYESSHKKKSDQFLTRIGYKPEEPSQQQTSIPTHPQDTIQGPPSLATEQSISAESLQTEPTHAHSNLQSDLPIDAEAQSMPTKIPPPHRESYRPEPYTQYEIEKYKHTQRRQQEQSIPKELLPEALPTPPSSNEPIKSEEMRRQEIYWSLPAEEANNFIKNQRKIPQKGSRPSTWSSLENVFHFLGQYVVGVPVELGLKGLGWLYNKVTDPLRGEEHLERRNSIYKWSLIGLTGAAAARKAYAWWTGDTFWGFLKKRSKPKAKNTIIQHAAINN